MLGKSRICITCPYNRFLIFLESKLSARPCLPLRMMEQIGCELRDEINPAWVLNRGIILNLRNITNNRHIKWHLLNNTDLTLYIFLTQ